ncbi:MAG: 50S ribosomal protein L11 methyltransferase, partial [Flavobacteriaceae bacterium]|nr:50S ribosomal protein L11 methyltransferase [Flavobacteriaceae bacterium]
MESESEFTALHFTVSPQQPWSDILLAELSDLPFDSFEETEFGLSAYILTKDWKAELLTKVAVLNNNKVSINYTQEQIAKVNWNKAWESNFEPITLENKCHIRAPFHPKADYPYSIEIMPQMSFGTGHHNTTYLMLNFILEHDFSQKKVLDMGCGTAVLAILTALKGAKQITAIDIDEWCISNSLENFQRNAIAQETFKVLQGDVEAISGKSYDVILANINRNVLLRQISAYAAALRVGGLLFMSGFYAEDIPLLVDEAKKYSLNFNEKKQKGLWCALKF